MCMRLGLITYFPPPVSRVWWQGSEDIQNLTLNEARFWIVDLITAIRKPGDYQRVILESLEQFFCSRIRVVTVFGHQSFEELFVFGDMLTNIILNE